MALGATETPATRVLLGRRRRSRLSTCARDGAGRGDERRARGRIPAPRCSPRRRWVRLALGLSRGADAPCPTTKPPPSTSASCARAAGAGGARKAAWHESPLGGRRRNFAPASGTSSSDTIIPRSTSVRVVNDTQKRKGGSIAMHCHTRVKISAKRPDHAPRDARASCIGGDFRDRSRVLDAISASLGSVSANATRPGSLLRRHEPPLFIFEASVCGKQSNSNQTTESLSPTQMATSH